MKKLLIVLACSCLVTARPLERLRPLNGVRLAKVWAQAGEKQADPELEKAVAAALGLKSGSEVRYLYNRVALTPKGKQTLVLLLDRNYWGSGGGTALLFDRDPDYRLLTRFTQVNPPVLVSDRQTRGWKDLVFQVRDSSPPESNGGGATAHYASLKFDGKGYPTNPSVAPDTPKGTILYGKAVLSDPLGPEAGLRFRAP